MYMFITIITSVISSLIVWFFTFMIQETIRNKGGLKFFIKRKYISSSDIRFLICISNISNSTKGFQNLSIEALYKNKILQTLVLESNYGLRNQLNELQNEYIKSEILLSKTLKDIVIVTSLPILVEKVTKLKIVYVDIKGKKHKQTLLKFKNGIEEEYKKEQRIDF